MGRVSVTIGTRHLIDTHVLLWDLKEDPRLSSRHAEIMSSDAEKFVSIATVWEIAIKAASGKLTVPAHLLNVIVSSDVELLPIKALHAMEAAPLPPHHTDPFDRMLISQARHEGLTILTSDRQSAAYDVPLG
jgi:PIN domain nuclease of toxin-antitoxin system